MKAGATDTQGVVMRSAGRIRAWSSGSGEGRGRPVIARRSSNDRTPERGRYIDRIRGSRRNPFQQRPGGGSDPRTRLDRRSDRISPGPVLAGRSGRDDPGPHRRTGEDQSAAVGSTVWKRSISRVSPRVRFSVATVSRNSSRPIDPRFRSTPNARIETSRFSASRGPTTAR